MNAPNFFRYKIDDSKAFNLYAKALKYLVTRGRYKTGFINSTLANTFIEACKGIIMRVNGDNEELSGVDSPISRDTTSRIKGFSEDKL